MPDVEQRYSKPALDVAGFMTHLRSRGLEISNDKDAEAALRYVGYYRLLIYMRPFQDVGKQFNKGTRLENIVSLYDFDRELRLLCLDGIERIEVSLRAAISNRIAHRYGAHFYLTRTNFSSMNGYAKFAKKSISAKYLAIEHYNNKYNTPPCAPFWAIAEAITYGDLSQLYSNLHLDHRK